VTLKPVLSPQIAAYEQPLEQMNNALHKIEKYIEEDASTDKITDIVDDTLEHTRDVWFKLLLIRMTLRRLLLKISQAHGVKLPPSPSMRGMTSTFLAFGIIDTHLSEQVGRIRDATYTVEWGEGKSPKSQDVRFTLENYGEVFDALKKRAGSAAPRA
jgi:hypothetical protein